MATLVKYAETLGGGNCASAIGWIDFRDIEGTITNVPTLVTNDIPGGYTITFYVSTETENDTMTPGEVPLITAAAFGNTGYTGFPDGSEVGLLSSSNTVNFNIRDIQITNASGEVINNYSIIAANAETTNTSETWIGETDGSVWTLLDTLPPTTGTASGPSVTGLNTLTVVQTGVDDLGSTNAPIVKTNAPNNLSFTFTSPNGNEGVAIGILINQTITSKLDAEIGSENKMIYVCPGSPQYFKASLNKSCSGNAIITYCGENFDNTTGRISGNLGEYQVVGSGIIFYPNANLVDGTMDMLVFNVDDGCSSTEITVAAVYSRCNSNCCGK